MHFVAGCAQKSSNSHHHSGSLMRTKTVDPASSSSVKSSVSVDTVVLVATIAQLVCHHLFVWHEHWL